MTKHLCLATLFILMLQTHDLASADEAQPSALGLEPGPRRLCNDDLGVIVWGPDAAPTLSVGKSDVWDRRLPPSEQPIITLKEIVEGARNGDKRILNGAAWYTAYNHYDFPCPKPVGQLILQLPFMNPSGKLTVGESPREIVLNATHGEKSLHLRIFVSAVRNLIVIRAKTQGLRPGDFAVRLWRHRDTIVPGGELHPTISGGRSPQDFEQLGPPRAGRHDDIFWIAQDFPPEQTFPNGFTSVLAATLSGASAEIETVEGAEGLGTPMVAEKEGRLSHGVYKRYTPINQSPGAAATARLREIPDDFALYATVVTTQDNPDPLLHAHVVLEEALTLGAEALWSEHVRQLDDYEKRPHAIIQMGDGKPVVDTPWGGVPYRVRPAGYYGDVPLCSVDSTKYCFQDSGMWHADFHFNEIEATRYCVLRRFDLLDSYFTVIENLLNMAQANARQVYDCPGAMYPLVHYPLKADTVIHTHVTWEQSLEITALLAKPFWLRFLYTWDTDFLRNRAWPVLREGARFYAAFLKKEEDGLYHVFPTVSPEHRGITRNLEFNRDSQSGITLIRYHLRAAVQAAKILGESLDEASSWQEIADHLPPYPTIETPNGVVFTDVAGGQPIEYNIPVPLSAVFWGDDIGLDSPPEQLELARRTLAHINVWEPHRGYLSRVRRRLAIFEPSDGIDIENVLQSHTGTIHVFPCVPADFAGSFENLGAQGAFIVSASRTSEGVEKIELHSLAGNACTIANPWPDNEITITCRQTGAYISADTNDVVFKFLTEPGKDYLITPATNSGKPG
ncbi:MAG: hypothetical protein HY706_21875 [Candidatus Hydrogenedentes bacterium]|nr:hypothetical protein [Candidatus Hydrogenedentota bacterium]